MGNGMRWCCIAALSMLAACGSGGGGGGGSSGLAAGKIVLTVDGNGKVTKAEMNCTTGGKTYDGTVDVAGGSVSMSKTGSCVNTSGNGVDLQNCTGKVSSTCNNVAVDCIQAAAQGQCGCDVSGLSQAQQDAAQTLLQEEKAVVNEIETATTAANNGQCDHSGSTYTCNC